MASFYPVKQRDKDGPAPTDVSSLLRSATHRQEVIARRLEAPPRPPATEAQKLHRLLIAKENSVFDVLRIACEAGDALDGNNLATALHKVAQIYKASPSRGQGGAPTGRMQRNAVWADTRFTQLLARGVSESLPEWRPRQLCHLVWSLAVLNADAGNVHWQPLCASFTHVIAEGVPQDISTVAWAVAAVSFSHEPLLDAIMQHSRARVSEYCPQDLSITAWSFAKLVYDTALPLMTDIAAESLIQLNSFGTRNLANLSWAFATIQHRDLPLYRALLDQLVDRIAELGPQELPITLWSVAAISYPSETLFDVAGARAPSMYHGMDISHICNIAWAFARAGPRNAELFESLAQAAIDRADQLEPLHIANLAWAFASLSKADELSNVVVGVHHPGLFEVLAHCCRRESPRLAPQHFSSILWAFGACFVIQGAKMVADEAATNLIRCNDQYDPRHLSGMLWALAELQLQGHPICSALLAASTRGGFTGLAKDGPMHLASITWASVRMSCDAQHHLRATLSVPGSSLYGVLAGQWQELSDGRQQNLAAVLRSLYRMGLAVAASELLDEFERTGVHPGLESWAAWLYGAAVCKDANLELRAWVGLAGTVHGACRSVALCACAVRALQDGRLQLALTVARQLQDLDCLSVHLRAHLERQCAGHAVPQLAPEADTPIRGEYKEELQVVSDVVTCVQPGSAVRMLAAMEQMAAHSPWASQILGMGAGPAGATLDASVSLAMAKPTETQRLAVFIGSGVGCAAIRAAQHFEAGSMGVVVMEVNPLCAAMAFSLIEWAGLRDRIEIWVGSAELLMPQLAERYGCACIGLLVLSSQGAVYAEELKCAESLQLMGQAAVVLAAGVWETLSPELVWRATNTACFESIFVESGADSDDGHLLMQYVLQPNDSSTTRCALPPAVAALRQSSDEASRRRSSAVLSKQVRLDRLATRPHGVPSPNRDASYLSMLEMLSIARPRRDQRGQWIVELPP